MKQGIETDDLTCPNCFEKTDSSRETCQHCDHVIPAYLRSKTTEQPNSLPRRAPEPEPPTPAPALALADLKKAPRETPEPIEEVRPEVIPARAPPSLAELKSVQVPNQDVAAAMVPTPQHTAPARPALKLLLRRSQKAGLTGTVTFVLEARAHVSEEMRALIKKYRMGREVVYAKAKVDTSGLHEMGAMRGFATALAARALNIKITVSNLIDGRVIECKDIMEMRAVEEQVKEACEALKLILESAVYFDGEEIIDI